jgi:glycosyltransferase involved in cell wall biosynthesis
MRALIHDYSGHPFQVQLSRSLAARGHEVLHVYSGSIASPRGPLTPKADDPPGFQIQGISLDRPVAKYDYLRRFMQELTYARLLEEVATSYDPTIVFCANTPIDIMSKLAALCRRKSVPWIFWLQDIYSVAVDRYFGRKVPLLGPPVSRYYALKERGLLRSARFVVAISDGFLPIIEQLGGELDNVVVIENWAPLDKISPRARDNPWSVAQGLQSKFCFLYAGTLGLKHNPDRLLELARHFASDANVRIVVVSEGRGADFLAEAKQISGLDNLILLPWQPFDELPNVLASADVLLAILEPDAGVLSVPSKVLSNLAVGRPQLLAVPLENLAAEIVTRENAGLVTAPDDSRTWIENAERLLRDAALRRELGRNARAYAERTFDIERITDRFEELMFAPEMGSNWAAWPDSHRMAPDRR